MSEPRGEAQREVTPERIAYQVRGRDAVLIQHALELVTRDAVVRASPNRGPPV